MAEKEYIEREGAYPLAKKICDAIDSKEFQRLNFWMRILDWIDDIPAADVRPVVLCRDCQHWDTDWEPNYARENEHFCPYIGLITREDWYCADGEKRGES